MIGSIIENFVGSILPLWIHTISLMLYIEVLPRIS